MSSTREVCERPSPSEGSCHFYVERKKRYCRFSPAKTSKYCAEHATLFEPDHGKKRILCPYNPKHTCYETKLNHHMKKCPSRPMQMPSMAHQSEISLTKMMDKPYHMQGINSGDSGGEVIPDPKATVVSEPIDVIEKIIEKVEQLHKEYIDNMEEEILSHPCLDDELRKKGYGTSALRQRKQQASLIGQMDRYGMLKDDTCFVEMGAGKGQMSHWLHSAVQDKKNIGFVLIERSHVRNKMDNLHKEEEAGHVMERVRIDIEHLKLGKIASIEEHDRHIVAFGKHLCGGATDLAVRCVVETLPNSFSVSASDSETSESQQKRLKSDRNSLAGVCIAVCCHHRCSWTPYVGKPFFKQCGFSAKDFQIISSMSSWATCAWKGWSYEKKCEKRTKEERVSNIDKSIVTEDEVIPQNRPHSDEVASSNDTQNQTSGKVDMKNPFSKDGFTEIEAPETSSLVSSNDTQDQNSGKEKIRTPCSKNAFIQIEAPDSSSLISSNDSQDQNNDNTEIKTSCNKDGFTQIQEPDTNMYENHEKIEKAYQENGVMQTEEPVTIKLEKSQKTEHTDDLDEKHRPVEDLYSSRIQDKVSQEEREKIGRKCKQLIDYGRVQYLKDHNMSSHLKVYIDDFYTPENIVLLATS